jgi:hypothetical protein
MGKKRGKRKKTPKIPTQNLVPVGWHRMEPNPELEACIRFLRGETSELPPDLAKKIDSICLELTNN